MRGINDSKNNKIDRIVIFVVIALFAILIFTKVHSLMEEYEQKERLKAEEQHNNEYLSKFKETTYNLLKDNKGLKKGFYFKAVSIKNDSITITYNCKVDELENKSFLYDFIINTAYISFSTISSADKEAKVNFYNIVVENIAEIKDISKDDLTGDYNGIIKTLTNKLKSKNGEFEKERSEQTQKELNSLYSNYDNIVNSMVSHIEQILSAAMTYDIQSVDEALNNAEIYKQSAISKLNNYKQTNPSQKVNAAYDVLTNYDHILSKVKKILETGKDSGAFNISLETWIKTFTDSVNVYKNTK